MQRPRLALGKYQVRPGPIAAYGSGNFRGLGLWRQRGEGLRLVVIPETLHRRLEVLVDPFARHKQDRQAGQNPLSRLRIVACDVKGSMEPGKPRIAFFRATLTGVKPSAERAQLRIALFQAILTGAKPGGGRGYPVACGILPTGKGGRPTG